jgi:hypothetical protein
LRLENFREISLKKNIKKINSKQEYACLILSQDSNLNFFVFYRLFLNYEISRYEVTGQKIIKKHFKEIIQAEETSWSRHI